MPIPPIRYDGRVFRAVHNSEGGEVGGDTRFYYHQEGDVVWATYLGGAVRFGTLVACVDPAGRLDMRYQHVNLAGELLTGTCASTPEVLPDGRLRLHERWQWTCGDRSAGTSVLEEVAGEIQAP